jgi:Protein of unknown function (DUF1631)
MAHSADYAELAEQARRIYAEQLVKGLPALVNTLAESARSQLDKPSEHARLMRRRELVQELQAGAATWHKTMVNGLREALLSRASTARPGNPPLPTTHSGPLSLVDDDTIEREILTSRLALAVMDRAASEFTDLRARMSTLERREELEPQDMLRAHVLARIVVDAWRSAGCSLVSWRELQFSLHDEVAALVEEAYHETNRWLVGHEVLAEVDLHPFIRRSRNVPASTGYSGGPGGGGSSGYGQSSGFGAGPGQGSSSDHGSAAGAGAAASYWAGPHAGASGDGHFPGRGSVGEETRMMTRAAPLARSGEHSEAVLGRLNRLVGRHIPAFGDASRSQKLSPALAQAIDSAQQGIRRRIGASIKRGGEPTVTTPALMEEMHQRKQALKQSAATPEERATIEIVALLFQSILTEERIPASVRVWFARLQMPVLRVAVTEPDFFATVDHPARRLIDRMGACVMGFDTSTRSVGDALEKEIKRVVQVVEAYPDTGRRVFQTVLTEFEKFLEHYFSTENEATRKGVSLAQQVEQRETMAIQYTIELRRMLNEMPVQESVRAFLFQVWADVLATTAVRYGAQGDETRAMKRAASDLIWSASAKVTREERAEVIRRLTPLLKTLRDGMSSTGMDAARQEEHIQILNNSLQAAFTAKAPVIPNERLQELAERLESLEELLPDAADVTIDDSIVFDLSGHESSELEVVSEGGSMPTPAMIAWARELQVGGWYMLDYRGRNEAVQLAWLGLRKQLSMFVTAQGRCVLFQQQRLASFLQAGLLLPAQDESLSVRATRSALAKLDVDPSRLLN